MEEGGNDGAYISASGKETLYMALSIAQIISTYSCDFLGLAGCGGTGGAWRVRWRG